MDTQNLIADAKARFSHNSAKKYLKEKYSSKLLVAEQNGLWLADSVTIATLQSFTEEKMVLVDTHNNPVLVDRVLLLEKLKTVYQNTMLEYHKEFKELETKR